MMNSACKEIAEMIFYCAHHGLNHVWSLHTQTLDGLKNVQEAFSFYSLEDVAECDEGSGPSRSGAEDKHTISDCIIKQI